MHESAMMMIHRAWGFAIGNEADMSDMAGVLRKIDGQLADIYAKQSGKTAAEMLALMAGDSDGTWFTAQEAADLGLADEVIAPDTEEPANPVAPESEEPDDPANPEEPDPEFAKSLSKLAAMRRRLALAEHD
jgi:hypothetical protein